MKVKVIAPFFDANGIHKRGEIMDVEKINTETMEPILDEKKVKEEKVEKAVAKTPKKTTRKKV